MLKIFDQNHKPVGTLIHYKNLKIVSDVTNGDKQMSFEVISASFDIKNEYYVQTSKDEFVIKKISGKSFDCLLNVEELEGNPFQEFSVANSSIQNAVNQAIDGTGWTLGYCDIPEDKLKNAGMINTDSYHAIVNLCTVWMCEPVFDTINKTVNIYQQYGNDKGVYIASGLNLRKLSKVSDSYDFYTRIVPIGFDGLGIKSVNGGRNYLSNYSYSTKRKTFLWIDETYTDANTLMEDATKYLEELSHPVESYSVDAIDLAKQNPKKYSVLSYGLGDFVTVIDFTTKTRTKQRIVKTTEYPQTPNKNSVDLTNRISRFTDYMKKVSDANNIETYEVTDGIFSGKVSLSKILRELRENN